MQKITQSEIKLSVGDHEVSAYLAAPQAGGPGILVLHAWWGLNPFFKQFCDRLAEHGFTALAPDLRNGEIAQTIQAAEALMKRSDSHFTAEIIRAARDLLLAHPVVQGKRLGVLGFSMGGAWSLAAATEAPDEFAAVVVFYGSQPADFGKMKAKFLGHYCEQDEWEPKEDILAMEADMRSAGVDASFHFYPGVHHWFMEDDRPEYDPTQAEIAWSRTLRFLRENLKVGEEG